jgi:hypothetical protein
MTSRPTTSLIDPKFIWQEEGTLEASQLFSIFLNMPQNQKDIFKILCRLNVDAPPKMRFVRSKEIIRNSFLTLKKQYRGEISLFSTIRISNLYWKIYQNEETINLYSDKLIYIKSIVHWKLASNKNSKISPIVLENLYMNISENKTLGYLKSIFYVYIAEHTNCPASLLHKLAINSVPEMRPYIRANPNVSQETKALLALLELSK